MRTTAIIIFAFLLLISCDNFGYQDQEEYPSGLPVLGFKLPIEKEVNGKKVIDSMEHTVGDFQFVNQDSNMISQADVEGKIYIADFFFTHCFTICPKVKKEMKRVYEQYKGNPEFLILSHSIDYRNDTVGRLAWYADKFNIESDNWHLLTGSYEDLSKIAYRYLLTAKKDQSAPGGFDHSGSIALLDRKQRIRGFYDGTDPEAVDELIADIQLLLDTE